MITEDQQRQLTAIAASTPMGELLRRYWHPVASSLQVSAGGVLPVRLLGEHLALFRQDDGTLALLDDRCPHRGVSLSQGLVASACLVCPYHGWAFDRHGACRAMPAEPPDTPLLERVKVRHYAVQELGGLVWAYLGPEPVPLLPRFDLLVWSHGLRDIGQATIPCHWLQIMENSVDPHHLEALHGEHLRHMRERRGLAPPSHYLRRHRRVAFERLPYGILKQRLLEGQSEEADDWSIGHPLIFPTMVRLGAGRQHRLQIRVPLDQTTTWHLWVAFYEAPREHPLPPQEEVPLYDVPWRDADGRFLSETVDGGDIMAWVSQGPIADRTRETLASSDRGVVMLRNLIFEQMAVVQRGGDPIGVVRDAEENRCIVLPQEREKYGSGKGFLAESMAMGHACHSPLYPKILELLAAPGL